MRISVKDFKMLYDEMYSFRCFVQLLGKKADRYSSESFTKKVKAVKELRVAKEDVT